MRLQNKNLYWPKTKALFKFLKGYVACRGAIAFIITWYKGSPYQLEETQCFSHLALRPTRTGHSVGNLIPTRAAATSGTSGD